MPSDASPACHQQPVGRLVWDSGLAIPVSMVSGYIDAAIAHSCEFCTGRMHMLEVLGEPRSRMPGRHTPRPTFLMSCASPQQRHGLAAVQTTLVFTYVLKKRPVEDPSVAVFTQQPLGRFDEEWETTAPVLLRCSAVAALAQSCALWYGRGHVASSKGAPIETTCGAQAPVHVVVLVVLVILLQHTHLQTSVQPTGWIPTEGTLKKSKLGATSSSSERCSQQPAGRSSWSPSSFNMAKRPNACTPGSCLLTAVHSSADATLGQLPSPGTPSVTSAARHILVVVLVVEEQHMQGRTAVQLKLLAALLKKRRS